MSTAALQSKEPKRQLLLSSLTTFFQQNQSSRETVYHIIMGASPISLRVLDWFVTHYSKMHQVMYWFDPNLKTPEYYTVCPQNPSPGLRKFHVYYEYRAQLKSFSKAHFDPFRRHQRISFLLEEKPEKVVLETTVGQLNFFKWAVQNRIIDYVINHLPEIEQSMASQTTRKEKEREKVLQASVPNANIKQARASARVHFD